MTINTPDGRITHIPGKWRSAPKVSALRSWWRSIHPCTRVDIMMIAMLVVALVFTLFCPNRAALMLAEYGVAPW